MKNYFSGYGHSLRLFPLNDDRENMVRLFSEYVKTRPDGYNELLREQFKRIGQRLWAAVKTLPLQDEEIEKFKFAPKVYDSDPLVCHDKEEFEFMDDQDMEINKHLLLRWLGRVPDFDASIELPEEEHVK